MPKIILGINSSGHDSAAAVFEDYQLKSAISLERITRKKSDGGAPYPDAVIDEALSIAGYSRKDVDVISHSRGYMPTEYFRGAKGFGLKRLRFWFRTRFRKRDYLVVMRQMRRAGTLDERDILDVPAFLKGKGFRNDTELHFYNHHEAHALPMLFYGGWQDALLVTADGIGDNLYYSYRYFDGKRLHLIEGSDDAILHGRGGVGLGRLYGEATGAMGFRQNRHEGKVTGLSAVGKPLVADRIGRLFSVDAEGLIHCSIVKAQEARNEMNAIAASYSREDFAASIQKVLEDNMLLSVERMLKKYPARHLGLAGGVFANVKLNRLLAESLPIDEMFVFPAMGDEGLSVGGPLVYLLKRDSLEAWLKQRHPLGQVYFGRSYNDEIDKVLENTVGVRRIAGPPVDAAVQRLEEGRIGAVYTGRMEFGPRALGARSILANPSRRETHDLLNERLDRSEFMPFAPVVTDKRAREVFEITDVNALACKYMTTACGVKPAWRDKIRAVVHVDHSARPQIVDRNDNPLYYDIIDAFDRKTGLPVLVNTSFNVHEEPIVNRPAECVVALTAGRIDFVVTEKALYEYTT